MFDFATFTTKRTLELPAAIAQHFQPSDRFIVWMEGDMVHFKRISHSPLQAVETAPADEASLSLEEIDAIVHDMRKRRHNPNAE